MPTISDIRHPVLYYDTGTLALALWDGSLQAGALVIGAVTQSGAWTVTADAGTNLNTSSLATQTTLASLLTELQAKADLAETQPMSLAVAPSTPVTGTFWQATQPVSGTFWQATQPVSGTFWQATQPVSGTVTANPATAAGKTITYVSVNQGAAGTTELAAASVGNFHKLVGVVLVISLLGTLKFTDGVADLTGPMDLAANGGFVLGASAYPYFQTGATNRALNLVTTLGAARGVVGILTEA